MTSHGVKKLQFVNAFLFLHLHMIWCVCRERRRLNGATHFSNHLPQSKAFVRVIFLSFCAFFLLISLPSFKNQMRFEKLKKKEWSQHLLLSCDWSHSFNLLPPFCLHVLHCDVCPHFLTQTYTQQRNKRKQRLWPTLAGTQTLTNITPIGKFYRLLVKS